MTTVPVTARALVQRINRALKSEDEILKTSRGERAQQAVGLYFTIDARRNAISRHDVDIEKLGRKLGVLKPYERLADEDKK